MFKGKGTFTLKSLLSAKFIDPSVYSDKCLRSFVANPVAAGDGSSADVPPIELRPENWLKFTILFTDPLTFSAHQSG